MGDFFKVLTNPLSLLALASGPVGLLANLFKDLFASIGAQLINQIGQMLGLPMSTISQALDIFGGQIGKPNGFFNNSGQSGVRQAVDNIQRQTGLSNYDSGQLFNSSQFSISSMIDAIKSKIEEALAGAKGKGKDGKGAQTNVAAELDIKGGFLVALALALGQVMDRKSDDIVKLAKQINDDGQATVGTEVKSGDTSRASRLQQQTSLLQGLSQELNTLSQALANALKSIGEGQQTVARKG
jgi:hypothetical protein